MGLYEYYGDQPTLIFGAPAWWFTIDAGFDLVAGLVLYSLRDHLKGWGFLLAVPIIPMVYAAMNGASGWPVFTALNSNYDASRNANGSELFLWAGGLGTIALALFAAGLALRTIARIVAADTAALVTPTFQADANVKTLV